MPRRKVVIFGLDDDLGCNLFAQLEDFCDVEYYGREATATAETFVEKARSADVLCIMTIVQLTETMLQQLPRTRLIVLWSTGYDYVDVAAATRCGIAICNNGHFSTHSVAEFQFVLLLALARKLPRFLPQAGALPEFSISFSATMGLELYGKTLGLIGAGAIGTDVARIARGFGMQVLAYNRTRYPNLEVDLGLRFVTLEELLPRADVISLNVPLNAETRHLLGPQEFAKMKRGLILINVARGPVIDEAALIAALQTGQVAAAGLDVLENNAPDNPLRRMDNVILTPHIAWLTTDAIRRQAEIMVENILAYFMGEAQNVVNKTYYNPLAAENRRLRPTLGSQVAVEVCQTLLGSLQTLGVEPYRAGQQWVLGMAERFSRGQVEEAVLQLREFMRDARLGLVRPTHISDQECALKLEESIRPLTASANTQPVCEFEAGVMAGVFEVVLGKPVTVEMCQCELRGEGECSFIIRPI